MNSSICRNRFLNKEFQLKQNTLLVIGLLLVAGLQGQVQAAEHSVHGLLDLRYSVTDGMSSYVDGGFGKFQFDDGDHWTLTQAALSYHGDFNNNLSVHVITNGYANSLNDGLGLTEAYLQYKSLPSRSGLRMETRAGLLYPRVSMDNVLTAWASPYTLDYSTLNSWIGEEVRHQGIEISVERLGKFHNSNQDFSIGAALIRANDPTGAMLAWHGWVVSSRQSLRHETLPLPDLPAGFVPEASDPFLELDDRLGYQLWTQWELHNRGKVLIGYYDNNADPQVVEDLQWAWTTRFAHIGVKWKLPGELELLAQYLQGDTLMESSSSGKDLVYDDYHSAYIMLSKKIKRQRFTVRFEEFAVVDEDDISSDVNTEYGKVATLSYVFRLDKHWFLHGEYSAIRSYRPIRANYNLDTKLTEHQTQIALRFFF